MTMPNQPLPGSFIPSNTSTTPSPGPVASRPQAFAEGHQMVGSPGLFATQDAENAAVPQSVTPALVGTFAQTVQSGRGKYH